MNSVAGKSLKWLSKPAVLVLLLLFCPVACQQSPPPREGQSTVLLNPSVPPCWYNICPGETTKDEAMTILLILPEVKQDITDRHYENAQSFISFVGWRFTDEVAEVGGRFYYQDQTVSHFYFSTENALTFGEAIEAFGEPTYVLPFSTCKWLYIALIYPDNGLYLIYFDGRGWRPGSQVKLTPEQSVSSAIFYNPTQFENLITSIEGANWTSYGYDDILRIMQSWEGFGEIQVYDPCRPQP